MVQASRAVKRILWVDDEVDLLKPHLLFLQARGYHVDAISNGDDALELLREFSYDLVLLDEQMPAGAAWRFWRSCGVRTRTNGWSWSRSPRRTTP